MMHLPRTVHFVTPNEIVPIEPLLRLFFNPSGWIFKYFHALRYTLLDHNNLIDQPFYLQGLVLNFLLPLVLIIKLKLMILFYRHDNISSLWWRGWGGGDDKAFRSFVWQET